MTPSFQEQNGAPGSITVEGAPSGRYLTPTPSAFSTPFHAMYEVIWDAEARFDLLFREHGGVYVWAANRVRFYYELATKLGLYTAQGGGKEPARRDRPAVSLEALAPVDAYVQTGAIGASTANRARPWGCVYTERYVKALLDRGRRVLLLHDAPERLVAHPALQVMTSRQLAALSSETRRHQPATRPYRLADDEARFWAEVDAFLQDRLGVTLLTRERIERLILTHARALATQRRLFRHVRPHGFLLMTHYFRAPQIEAAHEVGTRVVDYQHGINSRYHLGYGFPHLVPEARRIPYYPDEFWSWGDFWTDPAWFPALWCDVRTMGHHAATHRRGEPAVTSGVAAATKTLLCATSWAMQDSFREVAANLARRLPDWHIVIKLHPRETAAAYAAVAHDFANVTITPGNVDIREASRSASIVVSICSSSLFDVLLNGCRLIVVNAPSVEYAEDFVRRYELPVLELDAANIQDCLDKCAHQAVPLGEIFAAPPHAYVDEGIDHLASSVVGSPDRPAESRKHAKSWLRKWRALWAPLRETSAKARLARAESKQDATAIARAILALMELRGSSATYRQRFLKALWDVEHASGPALPRRWMDRYIATLGDDELVKNLPVLEHAMRLGVAAPLLQRFDVQLGERKWQGALALVARTGDVGRRMADTLAALGAAAGGEWLDGRVDRADQQRLFEDVAKRLRRGTAFAMIRLGDGEVYGFAPAYVKAATLAADQAARERIWWGAPQPPALRERLRREFQQALGAVDYLGIPSPFRLLRDIPTLSGQFRRPIDDWHRTLRAHFVLLHELARMRASAALDLAAMHLVDDRCHQHLFTPRATVELLSGLEHVVCISCFPKDVLNAALPAAVIDEHILLPPHQKVLDMVPDTPLRRLSTPVLLDELYRQIDASVRPGSTVLVAGGFVGKLLIARAKQRGGMVLDIGASADYWAGYATRGPFDFAEYA